jgi:hypothetical protein
METIAYIILGVLAIAYICVLIFGMIAALPWGLVGLLALLAFGLLFIKVVVQRLQSSEDDYYEENVDQ